VISADHLIRLAGVFPGQAILLSNMMDVFTLTGDAMTDRGDFFASMFIVMAAGCLVFYFGLGWSVNVVAQVLGPRCCQLPTRAYLV
jgi:ATP-binding cassette subfamily B (MDR/TAP) protein 1